MRTLFIFHGIIYKNKTITDHKFGFEHDSNKSIIKILVWNFLYLPILKTIIILQTYSTLSDGSPLNIFEIVGCLLRNFTNFMTVTHDMTFYIWHKYCIGTTCDPSPQH